MLNFSLKKVFLTPSFTQFTKLRYGKARYGTTRYGPVRYGTIRQTKDFSRYSTILATKVFCCVMRKLRGIGRVSYSSGRRFSILFLCFPRDITVFSVKFVQGTFLLFFMGHRVGEQSISVDVQIIYVVHTFYNNYKVQVLNDVYISFHEKRSPVLILKKYV